MGAHIGPIWVPYRLLAGQFCLSEICKQCNIYACTGDSSSQG